MKTFIQVMGVCVLGAATIVAMTSDLFVGLMSMTLFGVYTIVITAMGGKW